MAAHTHDAIQAGLTRNQSLVMDALAGASSPLSAYAILDQLREAGVRAPLQVYRALDKLVELGLVHRLESLNAFVACRHAGCETHDITAFTICESCGKVAEVTDDKLAGQLEEIARRQGFRASKSTVELRGLCKGCQSATASA
jgi:Fur family zinc uptake transcriptional regulator